MRLDRKHVYIGIGSFLFGILIGSVVAKWVVSYSWNEIYALEKSRHVETIIGTSRYLKTGRETDALDWLNIMNNTSLRRSIILDEKLSPDRLKPVYRKTLEIIDLYNAEFRAEIGDTD
ncbi:MAG: hypothetical protein ACI909_001516 [Planctomycetota bacterium]|jgi:hypothetical protein